MATLQELQAQRQQLLNEIKRRGGRGSNQNYAGTASGFESQLQQVENQIRTMRPADNKTNPQNTPPAAPTPQVTADIPGMQNQRKALLDQIHAAGGRGKNKQLDAQLAQLEGNLRSARKSAGQPTTEPPTTETPTPPTETAPTDQSGLEGDNPFQPPDVPLETAPRPDYTSPMTAQMDEATKAALGRLNGGVNSYLPTDPEGSQFYQFQKKQGLGDLEKLMAARGLTKSGAEIQANSDFLGKVGAEETERQKNWAMQQYQQDANTAGSFYGNALNDRAGTAQRNQNQDQFNHNQQYNWWNAFNNQANSNRDFAYGMQQDAQANDYNNSGRAWDNLYRFSALGLGQNPMSQAMSGTGDWASTVGKQGQTNAAYAAQNYARPTAGIGPAPSGGGGGGGSNNYPIWNPPPMSNVSTLPLNNVARGYANNSAYGNLIGSFGSFF